MSTDLNAISVFVAVADAKGFRAAGQRLGVSASAVSQSVRKLEERLGVVLLRRTSRSVHLTQAGEQLYATVGPALDNVVAAMAAVGTLGSEPQGTLRLAVYSGADPYLREHVLAGFLAAYPRVRLDLDVSNAIADIVDAGYDAGIRLGEVIDQDMIAVPVSGDIRLVVVGAPSYFARHAKPAHPRDLLVHECINWHPTPSAPPYRWEFTEDGHDVAVSVPMRALTTDATLLLRLARQGAGLAMLFEDSVRDEIARGALVTVLDKFCAPFPGFYLYYPQRRQASPALRAFIQYLREHSRRTGGKRG